MATTPLALLLLAVAAVVVLVLLVTWRKMNAFLALFIAALLVGLGAGLPPGAVLKSFQDGMDHYCQLAGDARHIGLGSDLDGAFGTEQTPLEVDSICDLQRLPELLRRRSFPEEAIAGILHGNLIRFLRAALE